jgi:superoxide dismutase, Fe-Mn family
MAMADGIRTASRRAFLRTLAGASGVALASSAGFAAAPEPPKEGGISSEGLLAGQPGFHSRTAAPLPHAEFPGFLSQRQLAAHHAEYVNQVEVLRGIEDALRSADRSAASGAYAELRRRQVASANSVLLHDFYFAGLAPAKVAMPGYVVRHMREHMGSLDSWAADFTACALGAHAWAMLVYDPYDDRWHNAVMNGDGGGVWIGANPLVVCDVSDHAWAIDYPRRADYVAKFIEHVDWTAVEKRYRRVDRM